LEPETLSGPAIAVSAIAFQRPAVIVSMPPHEFRRLLA
jgi:hypothetical protein